jgi:glycosyltransferase involved in cell wall biosynthesis
MPRKRRQQARQIIGSLHARGALRDWELQEISGMSHDQVAEALGSAQLFLSFSQREGFGLPPAEALARGCHVIGYAGWGGNEFFDGPNSTRILEDDLDGFVSAVADWTTGPGWDEQLARSASQAILQTYSAERERDSVLAFFAPLNQGLPASGPATAEITVRELAVPYRGPLRMMAGRVKARLEQMVGI